MGQDTGHSPSRRSFFVGTGAAIAAGAMVGNAAAQANSGGTTANARAKEAYKRREAAARQHRDAARPDHKTNGDEARYASARYYANFSKAMPCNDYGEVDPAAYRALVKAMSSGKQTDFDAVPINVGASHKLFNPQAAHKFSTSGLDSHDAHLPAPHQFRSAEIAAEMGEVYWQCLTRDIPYIEYEWHDGISAAIDDLARFSKQPCATKGGKPMHNTLFRGQTPGDMHGPFLSQFLWHDYSFGSLDVVQRYETPVAGIDFMTTHEHWLHVQRGHTPQETPTFEGEKRYIFNNRALGEFVHRDLTFQSYLGAALILLGYGKEALDPGNPYRDRIHNAEAFGTFGPPMIADLVTRAANQSLSGAWYQKWGLHRVLRPEAFAGRVHFHMTSNQKNYEIHQDLLRSRAVAMTFERNGTAFLPMAFIEGSPTHPSYPAGHAMMAGACVTVLKAMFNEDFVIPNPVQADRSGHSLVGYDGALTVGDELNKLANNIAFGRNGAGVHYRMDGIRGIGGGEQHAIAMLQDESRTVRETGFEGFCFTTFDGTKVRIKDGDVHFLSA